jgi:serine/threonine-protein kinase
LLDVVVDRGELFLVMEYVAGTTLSSLFTRALERGQPVPLAITSAIVCDLLRGLHAAHTATDERGELLGLVHRDVSPQNVLVTGDGVARVLDFGVAKARERLQTTRTGEIKGKLAYMAPEQFEGPAPSRPTCTPPASSYGSYSRFDGFIQATTKPRSPRRSVSAWSSRRAITRRTCPTSSTTW